jgi:hypothetical protein
MVKFLSYHSLSSPLVYDAHLCLPCPRTTSLVAGLSRVVFLRSAAQARDPVVVDLHHCYFSSIVSSLDLRCVVSLVPLLVFPLRFGRRTLTPPHRHRLRRPLPVHASLTA